MADGLSLEKLPLEVIHQIFSLLSPRDLTSLRLTSHSILSAATANAHWRRHFFDSLLPSHAALIDIPSIPHNQWAFQLVTDGWFRAYTTVIRIAREEWLHTDEELKGSTWMVFFKSFLREGGASSDDAAAHALVELRHDMTSVPIEGLPLHSTSWYVDQNKSLRFSGYPPNVPSRDPHTWCRVMQHVSVLMLTDSPEFLEALNVLSSTILEESYAAGLIDEDKRQALESGVRDSIRTVQEKRKSELSTRFRKLHLLRSSARERSMNCSYQGSSNLDSSRSGSSSGSGGERIVVSPMEEAGMYI
ncbi:hypothetical protein L873DRAFT_1689447 [Choiromyces venosus 120613-1]|uniref:F-box domain-containing protein n=1 Tax=Choiromyces venosus 120613-1 TaxID=1336337 RepID=A0A3N4JKX3_9PEZI|nr:hypothetical protein L873DRAFT_1689447 [Choiromyces venosus 120613-1]